MRYFIFLTFLFFIGCKEHKQPPQPKEPASAINTPIQVIPPVVKPDQQPEIILDVPEKEANIAEEKFEKVCIIVNNKEKCRIIKIHKKYEGTAVPQ